MPRNSSVRLASRPEPSAGAFVDDYLLYLLARASHVASAQFHAVLAERNVPVSVWRVLAGLQGAGAVTVGELARIVLLQQPTLTKLVDRLETRGLVRRIAAKEDRRRVYVEATPAGERLVAGLLADAKTHEAGILAGLAPAEAATLKSALRGLIAGFENAAG